MIKSFIHTSEMGNLYIYDDQHRLSMLVHPEFEKAYGKSSDTDLYYLKKYEYLKNHGLFSISEQIGFSSLEESTVRDNIIDTNQIVFETTDSCNLKCTYCALGELYEVFDARKGKKINANYAINLLKYIFENKPKNKKSKLFITFYGGEALLNIQFVKRIVETANKLNAGKKIDIQYSMTTNATLIHKYIDFLVENNFSLLISLDGDEKNHSYRIFDKDKKNSFHTVVENIDTIQRKYPEYFLTYVDFNAVLHDRNSVKEIYDFIYNKYNKIPRISQLNTRDARAEKKDVLNKMFQNRSKSEIEYLQEGSDLSHMIHGELTFYRELADFLKYYSINYYISNINALLNNIEKYLPTSTCSPFSKKIFLTNHNRLLPCEKINYKYFMGTVGENIDIDIPEITRQYNYYYEYIKKSCQNCYLYKFCGSCLFQMPNIDYIKEETFVCNGFCDQNMFKEKLYRVFSFLEKYPTDYAQILENLIIE